jgi:O-acetyl-ADP-ribose deacetylase (regulator of RNase III)
MEFTSFLDGRVIIRAGDITQERVDAIVNAANAALLGGGGVDGAIHRAGGEKIHQECQQIRRTTYPKGLPTGQAVITSGGDLKARFVIHTVGPVYGQENGKEAQLLADCYRNSLALALTKNIIALAFPAISTGAFGYPRHEAARISSQAIKDFLATDTQIKEVRLVFFAHQDARKFIKHQVF